MTSHRHARRTPQGLSAIGLAALAIGLTGVVLLPVGSASAASGTAPQLSIAVDDHHTSAREGDTLSYAITVKNLGGERVRALQVSQTVPEGLALRSADAHGVSHPGRVSWRVNLEPGGSATLHTAMKVRSTPQDLYRLASVACAGVDARRPLVCATHSDQLPAGAAAASRQADASDSSGPASDRGTWLAGLAGLLVVGGGVGVVLSRRRRPSRAVSQPRH